MEVKLLLLKKLQVIEKVKKHRGEKMYFASSVRKMYSGFLNSRPGYRMGYILSGTLHTIMNKGSFYCLFYESGLVRPTCNFLLHFIASSFVSKTLVFTILCEVI